MKDETGTASSEASCRLLLPSAVTDLTDRPTGYP